MLGLIIACLCIAFMMVFKSVSVEVAVASALPFLWYWHLTLACIFGLIICFVLLVGLIAMVFGDDAVVKLSGAAGIFVGAPIIALLGAIGAGLFLGGTYCVIHSITIDPATGQAAAFAAWDIPMFTIGCVLYGLGVLRQIYWHSANANTSKSGS